jgi:hypothetical protein
LQKDGSLRNDVLAERSLALRCRLLPHLIACRTPTCRRISCRRRVCPCYVP